MGREYYDGCLMRINSIYCYLFLRVWQPKIGNTLEIAYGYGDNIYGTFPISFNAIHAQYIECDFTNFCEIVISIDST